MLKVFPSPWRGSPQYLTAAQRSAACGTDEPGAAGWSSHAGRWTWGCSVCEELSEPAEKVKELLNRALMQSVCSRDYIIYQGYYTKAKKESALLLTCRSRVSSWCLMGMFLYSAALEMISMRPRTFVLAFRDILNSSGERTQTTVASDEIDVPRQSRSMFDA